MEHMLLRKKKRKAARVTVPVQTIYGRHLCEFIPNSEGDGYTVIAKYVPGVVTQGRSLREAGRMAREALELCIECLAAERLASRTTSRPRQRTLASARA